MSVECEKCGCNLMYGDNYDFECQMCKLEQELVETKEKLKSVVHDRNDLEYYLGVASDNMQIKDTTIATLAKALRVDANGGNIEINRLYAENVELRSKLNLAEKVIERGCFIYSCLSEYC